MTAAVGLGPGVGGGGGSGVGEGKAAVGVDGVYGGTEDTVPVGSGAGSVG
jgi:hypothetical protein